MKQSFVRVAVLASSVCLILGLSASPALALYDTTVPNHAIVGSVDLFDMTEAQAREAIAANATVPARSLQVTCAAKVFSLDLQQAAVVDVDAMLASAYTTPSVEATFALAPSYATSSTAVSSFVLKIAAAVNKPARNAMYYIRYGNLRYQSSLVGRRVNTSSASATIGRAVLAEAATGAPSAITLGYSKLAPAVTDSTVGRAIIVDLSTRKLGLYNRTSMITWYRVAVGMPGYETPRGTFKVVAKRAYPTWTNPGSAWASGMPSFIGPGYYNPLGVRALYLNAPGIRIHGTSATGSIGRAASHGCIRVANANIVKLYPLVPVGTKVFIVP